MEYFSFRHRHKQPVRKLLTQGDIRHLGPLADLSRSLDDLQKFMFVGVAEFAFAPEDMKLTGTLVRHEEIPRFGSGFINRNAFVILGKSGSGKQRQFGVSPLGIRVILANANALVGVIPLNDIGDGEIGRKFNGPSRNDVSDLQRIPFEITGLRLLFRLALTTTSVRWRILRLQRQVERDNMIDPFHRDRTGH